jgi:hypothetical protein
MSCDFVQLREIFSCLEVNIAVCAVVFTHRHALGGFSRSFFDRLPFFLVLSFDFFLAGFTFDLLLQVVEEIVDLLLSLIMLLLYALLLKNIISVLD